MNWSLPTWMILAVAVWFLIAMWNQHRPHATDHPNVCKNCRTSHPPFARFCRHCGKHLG